MATGFNIIPQRFDGKKFLFQRITEDQHVFFPLVPRNVDGMRNNNRVFWQPTPATISFDNGNNHSFSMTVFDTDTCGFVDLATPFRIVGNGRLSFIFNSAQVLIRHLWTHRFRDDDGNILTDTQGNALEINNATVSLLSSVLESQSGFFDLSELSRVIEVYPYQISQAISGKAMADGRQPNHYRIGIRLRLEIRVYSTHQKLEPVIRFGRVWDYRPTGNIVATPNETFTGVNYSDPSISFSQGTQGANQATGIIRKDSSYQIPEGTTQEQHDNSTAGQIITGAVSSITGTPNRLVVKRQQFSIPEFAVSKRISMTAGLAEKTLPFVPGGGGDGPASVLAGVGISIGEIGNYSLDVQAAVSLWRTFFGGLTHTMSFGVRVKLMREGQEVLSWENKGLYGDVADNDIAVNISVPRFVAQAGDTLEFEYVYQSLAQGDNVDIRSPADKKQFVTLIKEEF